MSASEKRATINRRAAIKLRKLIKGLERELDRMVTTAERLEPATTSRQRFYHKADVIRAQLKELCGW